jgi:hypothetical protein
VEALGDRAPHVGPLGEQPAQGEDHVGAVEAARLGEDAVVLGVERRELALAPGPLAGRLVARLAAQVGGPLGERGRVDRFCLQRVDAEQQPGQQAGRVAADLVVA